MAGEACRAGQCPPSSLPGWAIASVALLALLSVIFFIVAMRHMVVRRNGSL